MELYGEALALSRMLGDQESEGICLGGQGIAHYSLAQFDQAIELFDAAVDIARQIGNRLEEGRYLGNAGRAYRSMGQIGQALMLYTQALAIAREVGNRQDESTWVGCLGSAYRDIGQMLKAIEPYENALAIAKEIGDQRGICYRLGSLGLVYYFLGQYDSAIRYYHEALEIAMEIGDRRRQATLMGRIGLGEAYHALGQVRKAIKHHERSLSIAREIGYRRGLGYQLVALGQIALEKGDLARACQYCTDGLAQNVPENSYQAALWLGIVLLHQHDAATRDAFTDAASRCQVLLNKTPNLHGPLYSRAIALTGIAVCDLNWSKENQRVGLLVPVVDAYQRALEVCDAPGIIRDVLRALKMVRAANVSGLEPVFDLLEIE
jgi:tetratricopeptide (TPR) repeat protein